MIGNFASHALQPERQDGIFRFEPQAIKVCENETTVMSTPSPTAQGLHPDAESASSPSIAQAANDLRAAAGDKAREFVHTAEHKASALKERAVESAHQFRDNAAEKAHHLKETATDQWETTCETAKDIQVTAEDYIRQNPTKCVISALGLGFLIGLIVRR